MRAHALKNSRAFTLVELLVVVAIMLIVASIALAAVDQFTGARGLDAAVRRLRGAVRFARAHAASTGRNTNIIFQLGEGKVTIQTASGEQVKEPIFLPASVEFNPNYSDPTGQNREWPEDTNGDPMTALTMKPSGSVDMPGGNRTNFWIIVSDRDGDDTRGVEIVWTSGLAMQHDL